MKERPTAFQAFISELKRRVVRVTLMYGAAACAGLEAADLVGPGGDEGAGRVGFE